MLTLLLHLQSTYSAETQAQYCSNLKNHTKIKFLLFPSLEDIREEPHTVVLPLLKAIKVSEKEP